MLTVTDTLGLVVELGNRDLRTGGRVDLVSLGRVEWARG